MREDYFFDTEADLEAQEQLNDNIRAEMELHGYAAEARCPVHELEILDGLFDNLHNEINEARQQEIHANSINGTYYWKGYREGLERVVTILYKTLNQNFLAAKNE